MEKDDIKVLLISAVPPPVGGIATWTEEYLQYCRKKGYKTKIVNESMVGKRALTASDSWNIYDEAKRCFDIWHKINKELKTFSPDIVHLNTACSQTGVIRDLISIFFIKLHKKPCVLHCHCNIPDQMRTGRVKKLFFKNMVKLSSTVLVLNSSSLNYLEHLQKGDYEVVPNFIKDDFIVGQRTYNEKINTIIYIGHVRKTKGIDELLQTAYNYPNIKFLLAGPVTEDYSKEEILKKSKENVLLLGAVSLDKVKELLDKADIFILPSYTEGFSRALLEAMARGIPIITTDVGANRDMIEEKGGCIIQKEDSLGIINAIKHMESFQTRAIMGEWNIQKVKKFYSRSSVMKRIYTIYQNIL
ncbi:glycosyltransferase family 4 protein [Candidatus Merdisoma sp. JLR.KK006]|uniref:glycosyltransferase family 4 protein n=1 Tax=Candidatus Merdisoma sp. JLR.KK006 TaxID=3112626 RepID=UPI002FF13718